MLCVASDKSAGRSVTMRIREYIRALRVYRCEITQSLGLPESIKDHLFDAFAALMRGVRLLNGSAHLKKGC